MVLLGFVSTSVAAAEPKILTVNSDDSYRSDRGQHTIVFIDMRNRWGKRANFKLNGYVNGTKPNAVCLVYGNGSRVDTCLSVYDSEVMIKSKIKNFNTQDKENITDACSIIVSQYDKILSGTKNSNAKKLIRDRKSVFTTFGIACNNAIRTLWPDTRFAKASSNILVKCLSNNPEKCSDEVLCSSAVKKKNGEIAWATNNWLLGYVKEAKKRKLSCNVGDKAEFFFNTTVKKPSTNDLCGYEPSVSPNQISRKSIQRGLKLRGLYDGAIDGLLGKGSCAGFKDFMKYEARSKIVTADVLKRLKTKPSAATIAQYPSNIQNHTANKPLASLPSSGIHSKYELLSVDPYDGRKDGGNWTGAFIKLTGTLQGSRRSQVSFEISGNYPNKPAVNIGISDKRTINSIPSNVAEQRNHPHLGNRFFIEPWDLSDGKFKRFYNAIGEADRDIVRKICGTLSNRNFVERVV